MEVRPPNQKGNGIMSRFHAIAIIAVLGIFAVIWLTAAVILKLRGDDAPIIMGLLAVITIISAFGAALILFYLIRVAMEVGV